MMGSLNYGLGIMPKWTADQYELAQKKICKTIRRILNIQRIRNHTIPDRILLRMVGILPVYLQHQRMALLTLNRVYKNEKPTNLFQIIDRHLKKPDNWKPGRFLKRNFINLVAPRIECNVEEVNCVFRRKKHLRGES